MAITRRDFLTRMGQVGGIGATFLAMRALGFLDTEPVMADIDAAPGSGKGTSVVVLGGGIAGLVSAYELIQLGYAVTVLEARARPGGRNWTVRSGDTISLLDGSTQTCAWDAGHYQNFGPARLPSIHRNILGYCRKLGVELQVEINMSRSAHLQNDAVLGGSPAVMRQVENDARGYVSELLSKAVRGGSLDGDVTAEDRARLLDFLRTYGPLDNAGKYNGSDRAGYIKQAGAGDETGVLNKPIDLHTLLEARFWDGVLFDEQFDMQATMFQPVGGMDRIPYAFAKAIGSAIRFEAPVTELRKTPKGVRVIYTEKQKPSSIEADFCICALPLNLLARIPSDLSDAYQQVLKGCGYSGAYKIAWEARRFWEQDDDIYGGLEFVASGCSPIWFPSANPLADRGILISGYSGESNTFAKLSLAEKFDESRKSIEKLHPGKGKELEKPLYVGWGKVPFNEGSWIQSYGRNQNTWGGPNPATQPSTQPTTAPATPPGVALSPQTGGARDAGAARRQSNPGYETMIQPDDRIIFAGDHVSHLVAWQEGAVVSAIRAVQLIAQRVKAQG